MNATTTLVPVETTPYGNESTMNTTEQQQATDFWDSSTEVPDLNALSGPVVYWLGTSNFDVLHITGITCLSLSSLVSLSVLCYLSYPFNTSLWSRKLWERLIVYLALCDVFNSVTHLIDHAYMLANKQHLPDMACVAAAVILNEFALAQSILVSFTAFDGFTRLVRQKPLDIGKRDWKLLTGTVGFPAIVCIVGVSTETFGPAGAWCFIDEHKKLSALLFNVISIGSITSLGLMLVCYSVMWYFIRRKGVGAAKSSKYGNVSKMMMVFVSLYMIQWMPAAICTAWKVSGLKPPFVFYFLVVSFWNLGGVFNFLAYTFGRKKFQRVRPGK